MVSHGSEDWWDLPTPPMGHPHVKYSNGVTAGSWFRTGLQMAFFSLFHPEETEAGSSYCIKTGKSICRWTPTWNLGGNNQMAARPELGHCEDNIPPFTTDMGECHWFHWQDEGFGWMNQVDWVYIWEQWKASHEDLLPQFFGHVRNGGKKGFMLVGKFLDLFGLTTWFILYTSICVSGTTILAWNSD